MKGAAFPSPHVFSMWRELCSVPGLFWPLADSPSLGWSRNGLRGVGMADTAQSLLTSEGGSCLHGLRPPGRGPAPQQHCLPGAGKSARFWLSEHEGTAVQRPQLHPLSCHSCEQRCCYGLHRLPLSTVRNLGGKKGCDFWGPQRPQEV